MGKVASQVTTDQVLRVTAGVLLALLAWQGRDICARLTRLETTQTRILVTLGIPPIGADTREIGVKTGVLAAAERIKRIKPGENPPGDTRKIQDFVLDLPTVTVVDSPSLCVWNCQRVH
jgi:hypothetical protein